jgi:hypothetical protein
LVERQIGSGCGRVRILKLTGGCGHSKAKLISGESVIAVRLQEAAKIVKGRNRNTRRQPFGRVLGREHVENLF